jgi:NifU-like protein involved in Fe-S cluster formation
MRRLPPELDDHFRAPRAAGRIEGPTHRGKAEHPACGDVLEVELRVADGRVVDAGFMAHACSSVIAVASLAVDALKGEDEAAARGFDASRAVDAAGGLPENRRHAVAVVTRALAAAWSSGA